MKTKKKIVKKDKEKVVNNNGEVLGVVVQNKVTQAIKTYIYENMGRLSTAEIAQHCSLSEKEVIDIATSAELDVKPEDKADGVSRIRRYDRYKGAVVMTAAQSMLDDREHQKNLPTQDEINSNFGKDFEKIKIKKPV